MTAEEILSKHTGKTGIYLTKGEHYGKDVLEAMEEYAQMRCSESQKSAIPIVRLSLPDAYSIREQARRLDPKSDDYKDGFEDGVYWLINRIKKGNEA